ncbi:hypothetical protein JCM10212_001338 [Sporobolomyces blumeae]
MNLKPLHHLYQVISPESLLLGDEPPFVALSHLERSDSLDDPTSVQCVISLGKTSSVPHRRDEWWTATILREQLERIADKLVRDGVDPSTLPASIRDSWIRGHLDLKGLPGTRMSSSSSSSSSDRQVEPRKEIKAIDYPATMKPGQKGYAGNAYRPGRNVDDDEWDEPDDEDDD